MLSLDFSLYISPWMTWRLNSWARSTKKTARTKERKKYILYLNASNILVFKDVCAMDQ